MTEHPILFSGPMIRALLNTRIGEPGPIDPAKPYKSRTRRMSKQWLKVRAGDYLWVRETWRVWGFREDNPVTFEYAADGARQEENEQAETAATYESWYERICVSCTEELAELHRQGKGGVVHDGDVYHWNGGPNPMRWRPSIFMPRWASRIRLQATEDARLERLQDITEEDARLEGVDAERWVRIGGDGGVSYRLGFRSIWHSLHTKPGERWEDNPELVRLAFRRVS